MRHNTSTGREEDKEIYASIYSRFMVRKERLETVILSRSRLLSAQPHRSSIHVALNASTTPNQSIEQNFIAFPFPPLSVNYYDAYYDYC